MNVADERGRVFEDRGGAVGRREVSLKADRGAGNASSNRGCAPRPFLLSLLVAQIIAFPSALLSAPLSEVAWLESVEILITPEEREVFLRLEHGYQRAEFIERFWEARDPDSATTRNELRDAWPERVRAARNQFGDLRRDRSRVFLLEGPPQFILSELCPEDLRPLEIWFYSRREPKSDFTVVFLGDSPETEEAALKLWSLATGSLADLLLVPPPREVKPTAIRRRLRSSCRRGQEILAALDQSAEWSSRLEPPRTDWLADFETRILAGFPREPMTAELDFHFPGPVQNLTIVDTLLTVLLDADTSFADSPPQFQLDGDLFRRGEAFDSFRYRFEVPPDEIDDGRLLLAFRRHLPPGVYRLVLTAQERTSKRFFHAEHELRVPSLIQSNMGEEAAFGTPNGGEVSGPDTLDSEGLVFKILPPPTGLLTGRQRIDVLTAGDQVSKVLFLLDDQPILSKTRPPFTVELDLGRKPRTHLLEAVGLTDDDEEVARDRIPINAGPHRFGVRLVEPQQGRQYRDSLQAHAEVDLPPGDKLDRVEFYLNETRAAVLYQPPFVQPHLRLPQGGQSAYVRTVAYLVDGNSAEDLAIINTSETVDRVNVDFVELYTSVVDRRGSAVEGLAREDFTVLENDVRQEIRRFESVRDLPINAGIVLDTSTSMAEEIEVAEEAALQFLHNVIQSKDRAAVIVFSDEPVLRVTLTSDLNRLAAGLTGVVAEGETTLYDSVIFGLYYLAGLRGKRALILLSDGLDSRSRYSFPDVLDFARQSGVAIYPIGMGISKRDHAAVRALRQLARETGGGCFFINTAQELDRIYGKIEEELRSQYLIGYQSTESDSEGFRKVTVDVGRQGLKVKTIPGYYP
jgi:VWFA-related protein